MRNSQGKKLYTTHAHTLLNIKSMNVNRIGILHWFQTADKHHHWFHMFENLNII